MWYYYNRTIKLPLYSSIHVDPNTVRGYHFIKITREKVVVFKHTQGWYGHSFNSDPTIIINPKYLIINSKEDIWDLCRDNMLGDTRINFIRIGNVITFPDGQQISYEHIGKIKLNTNFNLINKPPKAVIKRIKEILDNDAAAKNRSSRAYYHNKMARSRLHKAQESDSLATLPMDDVFKLTNVSDRAILITHFGMDTILASLDTKVINKDTINGRKYELIEVAIPDKFEESGAREGTYLRMTNPSTDEIHFEGVPNVGNRWDSLNEGTVSCALAWRDNESGTYIKPEVLT